MLRGALVTSNKSIASLLLFFLGTAPLTFLSGCAASPAEPEEGDTEVTADALKYCPPTDPDYPTCGVVTDPCADATATITASLASINYGASTTIQWSVKKPSRCLGAISVDGQTVGTSGSKVVTPLSTTAYQVRLGGRALATANVNVILPSTVRINGSTLEWRRLLVQAVGTPNTRVVLANDVDMDMSNLENIYVREGVTLTSEAPIVMQPVVAPLGQAPVAAQPAAVGFGPMKILPGTVFDPPPARNAHTLGPRLYTTTKPKPLFHIRCNSDHSLWGDNVRFRGFRLQGPHWDTEEGDDNLERGIMVHSCVGVEIDNMELSGFSGQAVYVVDDLDRQFNPDAVKIHDSFLHHNQHEGGNGYGVVVSAGGYAKIERNVFDFNRHAIAASGALGVGYMADRNLVLRGGGVHGKWYSEYTHQFDVHGDANCPDIPLNQHTWNCGNAGDQFWFTNNAFQYTNDLAIKLRGVPRIQAVIRDNVFAHDSEDDAVATKSDVHVFQGPNTSNVDTYGNYGVCDFDGDGKDDLFLATGVSWWYSSGGKMNWVYLNSHTERLSQVGLGDFNGDGRCDVFAINKGTGAWEISSGGRSAWTALPGTYSVPFEELRFGDFNGDKITDVFRRAPDGQWFAVSPGYYPWTALQSSSIPLADLRFGDFDGNGVTDVLRRSGSSWVVSLGATTPWQPWNDLGDDLGGFLIGNVDGIPGDDVLRYVPTSTTSGRWDVSSGGRAPWKTFASQSWSGSLTASLQVRSFVGRFDGIGGADLLAIDHDRRSHIFSAGKAGFTPYGLYAY